VLVCAMFVHLRITPEQRRTDLLILYIIWIRFRLQRVELRGCINLFRGLENRNIKLLVVFQLLIIGSLWIVTDW
jgi:hypothetical protein